MVETKERPVRRRIVVEDREELLYLLGEAAELEHAICCSYLFAAFGLKTRPEDGLTAEQHATVLRWKRTLNHIALQEMAHLALANNLLAAVGGAPHLDRPPFPQQIGYIPEIQLELTPFNERTLERFLYLERPEGMDLDDVARDIEIACSPRLPQLVAPSFVPEPQDFDGIGGLYRELERGLDHLVDKYGESAVFVGSRRTQSCAALFAFPEQVAELVPVSDLGTAKLAMETIVTEGEGAQGDWSTAHFGRFMAILREYQSLLQDDPEFQPARPVAENPYGRVPHGLLRAPVWPPDPMGRETVITVIDNPDAAKVCDLFDACYAVLLRLLERFFNHGEETDAELRMLADTAVDVMYSVIRPLGELLTTLPAGSSHPDLFAGPSFFVGGWTPVTSHKPAAWAVLRERLGELADVAADLDVGSADRPTGVADTLRAASARFSPVS
jgi:Ferritin-like